jgi:hypothetical protein
MIFLGRRIADWFSGNSSAMIFLLEPIRTLSNCLMFRYSNQVHSSSQLMHAQLARSDQFFFNAKKEFIDIVKLTQFLATRRKYNYKFNTCI